MKENESEYNREKIGGRKLQLISSRKKKTNEQLVEEILLEQYEQYYRLAYSYVKNEADAGDIVQNGA